MLTFKKKIDKLNEISRKTYEDALYRAKLAYVLHVDLPNEWNIVINKDKNVFVAIAPNGTKYVKRPVGDDVFDPYTAMALCYFENRHGIKYWRLADFIETFAKCTKTNDPTINFLKLYFEGETGISKADFAKLIEDGKNTNAGVNFHLDLHDVIEYKARKVVAVKEAVPAKLPSPATVTPAPTPKPRPKQEMRPEESLLRDIFGSIFGQI